MSKKKYNFTIKKKSPTSIFFNKKTEGLILFEVTHFCRFYFLRKNYFAKKVDLLYNKANFVGS